MSIKNAIEIDRFSFKKIHLKMSSGKRRPFCLGLNVLMLILQISTQLGSVEAVAEWTIAGRPYP